ncbi:MAG: hypothetical protein ABFS37_16660, partial [Acidobacteriota bacterium]
MGCGKGMTAVVAAGLALAGACARSERSAIPDLAHHRARHAMEQARWDWARVYLEEDLEVNPDRHQSVLDLAVAWISGHGGGLANGLLFLEDYLRQCPDDQESRRRLVTILTRLKEYDRGRHWAEGFDDHPDAHFLRALLEAGDDPQAALGHLKATLEADDRHAAAWALLAEIQQDRDEVSAALEAYRRSLALDPFRAKVRARLERLLKQKGETDEAHRQLRALEIVGRLNQSRDAAVLSVVEELRLLRELQSLTSASGFVFDRRLAEVLLRMGHLDEGLSLVEGLEKDERFSVEDRLVFAKIMGGGGERQHARSMYQGILRLDPGNVTARASMAVLDCGIGRHEEARRRMEEALEGDPWVAVFHAGLAQALLLGGDEEAAIAHWETALALAPWETPWRRQLVRILRARGERNRAEAVLA